MKIGIVLASTPGYSETFFRSKIKGLRDQGHEVILFVQETHKDFNLCNVVVAPKVYSSTLVNGFAMMWLTLKVLPFLKPVGRLISLERSHKKSWSVALKSVYVNAHILKQKLDWLHFGFATQALKREWVAKAIGAKMGVSFRGFDITTYPLKHPNCYEALWKSVDKVHTISDHLLEKGHQLGLPKTVRACKITPAIDCSLFIPGTKKKEMLSKPIQFLTVARFHFIKGIEHMLMALSMLKKEGVPFHYTLVGTGSKKEMERVIFAVQQLDLVHEVSLTGKLIPSEIKHYYERCDIYLQYSISEGFCNAVLEAQAMGLICIVSDAGGLSENVIHQKTGWVVPKMHPNLLAVQIWNVLQMPQAVLMEVTDFAKERIKTHFSIEKQQKEFVAFYGQPIDELLTRR
ncbi:MAG TPA: glycosyltransferase family 4 protein [Flavobacteriaceae bacterium]|nr:glycosyltransferase family 4 protein [Flavobacteriaceae bacterium]HPF12435.1 glycosyltransferase family 4 protein [Flavobacteriaceae bacterium]HQU21618.1 glycosyltransferase family 4 protein [Flavobacteriaceae bacterium]HQU66193.1 glycosyltransferase family 4 protein [Flavobacteriaceae bacterium]